MSDQFENSDQHDPDPPHPGPLPQERENAGNGSLSRRGFLKGIGIGGAAASVVTAVKPLAEAASRDKNLIGPGDVPISLKINGKTKKLNVEPRVTLLDALRNRLDIT